MFSFTSVTEGEYMWKGNPAESGIVIGREILTDPVRPHLAVARAERYEQTKKRDSEISGRHVTIGIDGAGWYIEDNSEIGSLIGDGGRQYERRAKKKLKLLPMPALILPKEERGGLFACSLWK